MKRIILNFCAIVLSLGASAPLDMHLVHAAPPLKPDGFYSACVTGARSPICPRIQVVSDIYTPTDPDFGDVDWLTVTGTNIPPVSEASLALESYDSSGHDPWSGAGVSLNSDATLYARIPIPCPVFSSGSEVVVKLQDFSRGGFVYAQTVYTSHCA